MKERGLQNAQNFKAINIENQYTDGLQMAKSVNPVSGRDTVEKTYKKQLYQNPISRVTNLMNFLKL